MNRDEDLEPNDGTALFGPLDGGGPRKDVMGDVRVAACMRVYARAPVMVIVVIVQMRVEERRGQRPGLKGRREPDGDEWPEHRPRFYWKVLFLTGASGRNSCARV